MHTTLTASDGHRLDAFVARPEGEPIAGLVIAQEMYGLTDYLKDVCHYFAGRGFLTVAPALYDRKEPGLVFDYDKPSHDRAQRIYKNWDFEDSLKDLDAAKAHVASAGKVGIVGYCWGGTLAWLAACRRDYSAAVAYYGSLMPDYAQENAMCPTIAIIGTEDTTIPPDRLDMFRKAQPTIPVHLYSGAKHGFDNPMRVERYHPQACDEARQLTVAFLSEYLARSNSEVTNV
jgi:carboxymethylenebutenolidase